MFALIRASHFTACFSSHFSAGRNLHARGVFSSQSHCNNPSSYACRHPTRADTTAFTQSPQTRCERKRTRARARCAGRSQIPYRSYPWGSGAPFGIACEGDQWNSIPGLDVCGTGVHLHGGFLSRIENRKLPRAEVFQQWRGRQLMPSQHSYGEK